MLNPKTRIVRIASFAVAVVGAICMEVAAIAYGYASSPHYGWLMHRWAMTTGLAAAFSAAAFLLASGKWRWAAGCLAVALALTAADPVRRLLTTDVWYDR